MNLPDDLKKLLESYAQPCTGDCSHSQCPLLRELHALRIKASLEQARLTVKPIVDQEKRGEEVGDLMNMRLTAQSDNQPALQPPDRYWVETRTQHAFTVKPEPYVETVEYARVRIKQALLEWKPLATTAPLAASVEEESERG